MKQISEHLRAKFPTKEFAFPKKAFAFGDLLFKTDNADIDHPRYNAGEPGYVRWNFHVAIIVRVKLSDSNKLYILDPSLSRVPLTKEQWYSTLEGSPWQSVGLRLRGSVTGYITCETNTYENDDDCLNPEIDEDAVLMDANGFLHE